MSSNGWIEVKLGDITLNFSSKRIPLSSNEREKRQGKYPYYGAQGVIDYIDDYIFVLPSEPILSQYIHSQELYDAIQMAELQANDPNADSIEKIADDAIAKLTFNIGEGNYVLVD